MPAIPESARLSALNLMKNRTILAVVACAWVIVVCPARAVSSATLSATDWPAWRGPTRDGIAAAGQNPPIQWSETEGILWKAPVPGRGHGSPIVVGDHIFVVSDPAELLCVNAADGKVIADAARLLLLG